MSSAKRNKSRASRTMSSDIPKYSLRDIILSLSIAADSGKTAAVHSFKRLGITKLGSTKIDKIKVNDLQEIITHADLGLPAETLSKATQAAEKMRSEHPLSASLIMQLASLPFDRLHKSQNLKVRGKKGVSYRLE
jgi:hypothetical protein